MKTQVVARPSLLACEFTQETQEELWMSHGICWDIEGSLCHFWFSCGLWRLHTLGFQRLLDILWKKPMDFPNISNKGPSILLMLNRTPRVGPDEAIREAQMMKFKPLDDCEVHGVWAWRPSEAGHLK